MRNSVGGLYRIARPGSTSPAREPLDRIPIALPLDLAKTAIGADQLGAVGETLGVLHRAFEPDREIVATMGTRLLDLALHRDAGRHVLGLRPFGSVALWPGRLRCLRRFGCLTLTFGLRFSCRWIIAARCPFAA